MRRRKETFKDLDIIATATDPRRADGVLHELPWVVDVVAHGDTKATVLSNEGLRFDLRVVPAGVVRQPAAALHRLEGAQRRDARGRGPPRALDLRVRRHDGRDRRGVQDRGRGRALRVPRLSADPAGAARERAASSRPRARGELPELVELARHPRRHAHAHALVGGRQEHARGDGRGGGRARLRVLRGHRSLALPARGQARARSSRRSSSCARSFRSCASWRASRRTSARTARSTCPEDELAQLDWVVASVHNAPENRPTERVLEAMDNPYVDCIGHLTGRRIRTRGPRDVDVERVIEKALEVGCFLEINGQPDRLDLRDVHARAAKEAGLKLVAQLRRAPGPRAGLRRARRRRRRGAAG